MRWQLRLRWSVCLCVLSEFSSPSPLRVRSSHKSKCAIKAEGFRAGIGIKFRVTQDTGASCFLPLSRGTLEPCSCEVAFAAAHTGSAHRPHPARTHAPSSAGSSLFARRRAVRLSCHEARSERAHTQTADKGQVATRVQLPFPWGECSPTQV